MTAVTAVTAVTAARISLHGGHSRPACAHAEAPLEAILEAAVALGMTHYGITEHAPKSRAEDLDEDEVAEGRTPEELHQRFRELLTVEVPRLQARFGDRIQLLVGMETDALPSEDFPRRMAALREEFAVEYLVGSVHHVDDIPIDADAASYRRAVEAHGDEEHLHLHYYATQAHLLDTLRPEVVGHLDLIRKCAPAPVMTELLSRAIEENLERIADLRLLLEINASPLRDGHDEPYPGGEILARARRRGVRITFGDDAHGPDQVAGGLAECADWARDAGFRDFSFLRRGPDGLEEVRERL